MKFRKTRFVIFFLLKSAVFGISKLKIMGALQKSGSQKSYLTEKKRLMLQVTALVQEAGQLTTKVVGM